MERELMQVEVVVPRQATAPSQRLASGLEALAFLAALLLYIWYFQARAPVTWTALLAMLVLSQLVHGESPAVLGVRWSGFDESARRFLLPVLSLVTATVCCGAVLHSLRPVPPIRVVGVFVGYLWWALLQQYLLNAFFVTRLSTALAGQSEYVVALTAGAFFAAAHLPNALLVNVTFIAGTLSALVYQRHRNLLFLAIAHAMLGTTIWFVVPDSISHGLRVGPGMAGRHQNVHRSRHSGLADRSRQNLMPRNQATLFGTVAKGSLVSSSR